jgi:F0F1-type ATP synthase membrane subunit b/b'
MNLTPNPALIALQMIPFLLTLVALHKIIFQPMLAYLHDRKAAVASSRNEAASLGSSLAEQMADYEQRLAAGRAQVTELKARRRASALREAEAIVQAARAEAQAQVDSGVARIQSESVQARVELDSTARALAGQIAGRVLGRPAMEG